MEDAAALRVALEAATSSNEWATIAITVGVAIEFLALLIFSKELPRKELIAIVFGNTLVVGGLGGEYIFGGRAATAATQLQQISDEKVAALVVRSKELSVELAKLKSSRILTSEQLSQLTRAAGQFKGTRFNMAVIPGDPEAINLLNQIGNALRSGGWTWVEWSGPKDPLEMVYNPPGAPNIGQMGGIGVLIGLDADHAPSFWGAAHALSNTLNADNVLTSAEAGTMQRVPHPDTMHIIVGKKPQ